MFPPSRLDNSKSGGIPKPPPTTMLFVAWSGSVNPFPNGPIIRMRSFFCNCENCFVPFPAILYTIVTLFSEIADKLIGRANRFLLSGGYNIINCPGPAVRAISDAASSIFHIPDVISSWFTIVARQYLFIPSLLSHESVMLLSFSLTDAANSHDIF